MSSSNFQTFVVTLANEVKALHAECIVDKRAIDGRVYEMGRKITEIRQAMREHNGAGSGRLAMDGRPPNGWTPSWIMEHLGITPSHASRCVAKFLKPEMVTRRESISKSRFILAGGVAFNHLRRWDGFSDKNKRRIAEFVIAKVREEQAHG